MAPSRSLVLPEPRLDRIENYPETADFIKKAVLGLGNARPMVADVGGGANPALDCEFVQQHNVDYALLDISQAELDKAPAYFRKIQVDMTAPEEDFAARVGEAGSTLCALTSSSSTCAIRSWFTAISIVP